MNSNVSEWQTLLAPHATPKTMNVPVVDRSTGRHGTASVECHNDSDVEVIFRISVERDAGPQR